MDVLFFGVYKVYLIKQFPYVPFKKNDAIYIKIIFSTNYQRIKNTIHHIQGV